MTNVLRDRHAVSLYGLVPIPACKSRRMAAVRCRVGPLRYKQIRLTMDAAVLHRRLRKLIRELAEMRERVAADA
jgi:hypothetical protein